MGWVFSLVWPVGMGEIGNGKEGGRKEGGPAVAVPYVQLRPKCESPKKGPNSHYYYYNGWRKGESEKRQFLRPPEGEKSRVETGKGGRVENCPFRPLQLCFPPSPPLFNPLSQLPKNQGGK